MKQADVLIVGGGIVGSVLAKGLCELTSLSVVLVDAQARNNHQSINPSEDKRVIALAKRTVNELNAMGVPLKALAERNPGKIEHIEVSDKGWLGMTLLDCSTFNLDSFGQVVALSALTQQVEAQTPHDRVTHLASASVAKITRTADDAHVTLSTGDTWQTKLVVLADGGHSPLAEQVGIQRQSESYHQVAIVANVHTQEPHNNCAYERFTAHGPLAFLPFDSAIAGKKAQGNGFSVVWTVAPETASTLLSLPKAQFMAQLQQSFGYRQGVITSVSDLVSYPLALSYTDSVYSHRSVVVGNAAQTLHPIAGQGFNLALRDIVTLVNLLKDSQDPGEFATLREYGKLRDADRSRTIKLTDTLVRTFSNSYFPLVLARNCGLLALNMVPDIKRAFVKQTTGFASATANK